MMNKIVEFHGKGLHALDYCDILDLISRGYKHIKFVYHDQNNKLHRMNTL